MVLFGVPFKGGLKVLQQAVKLHATTRTQEEITMLVRKERHIREEATTSSITIVTKATK
jgi:hypothetical protein